MTGQTIADAQYQDVTAAYADAVSIVANRSTVILASELLANDEDPDGDVIDISSVQNAEHGTVSLDVDGNVVFTPDADYYGPAVFSYTIDDGTGETSTATVTIDVKATLDESQLISGAGGKLYYNSSQNTYVWDAAQLQDGGHVTVWRESGYNYLTLTNADGTTQRNRYVMPNSAGHVTEVKVEGLAGGGFVVFESSSAYSPQRTSFVVYNASGNAVGQRQLVTTESRQQGSPEIIALQDGGFVLLFKYQMSGGSSDDTFGQRYDASGDAIGERFEISGAVSGTDMSANGVELADGRLVIFSKNASGLTDTTTLQVFSSHGVKLGDSVVAMQGPGNEAKFEPTSMLLADGRVAVTIGTTLQVYSIDVDNVVTLDTTVDIDAANMTAGDVTFSDVVALADGGTFVAFTRLVPGGFAKIYGQRYDAAGHPVNGEVDFEDLAYGAELNVRLEPSSDGGVYLYYSNENASGTNDLYRIHVDGGVTGQTIADAQYQDVTPEIGGIGNDVIVGSASADVLLGNAGDDVLSGGSGDDIMSGGSGADTFVFGRGADNDTISDAESSDQVSLQSGIEVEDVWLFQDGNDLVIQLLGSEDSLTVADWYGSSPHQVGEIDVAGSSLSASNVQSLVDAMSVFGIGDVSADTIDHNSTDFQNVQTVIVANWQSS